MITRDDQRDFIRMTVQAPVTIEVADSGTRIRGTCLDLSDTGMSLEVAERLALDTQLLVVLDAGQQVSALRAQCRVMRCEETQPGVFQLGCETLSLE